ncbi:MAG: HIT domain-containing protein [Chloroflexi bacterium]|nr:HIT domain-containing protein [Chloroflexota bacterium]
MERLWSPWRLEYILSEKGQGCIFCDKIADDDDQANYVLQRGETCYVMLNLYPYNNGHLMVSPYRHVPSLEQLEENELTEMMLLLNKSFKALRRAMHPDGFNVGINIGKAAGAGIEEHVHIHVVPRWKADTNFMPVLSQTRVIPELLDETYRRLKAAWEEGEQGAW